MGAELNAGTGKETTSVYARVLDEHLERAFDVMAQMVVVPAMEGLAEEREVMLEEIAMYEDDPQEKVFDVLGEAIFPDDPLGRAILGRAEVVGSATREQLLAFHRERYFAAQHRDRRRRQRRARADRRTGLAARSAAAGQGAPGDHGLLDAAPPPQAAGERPLSRARTPSSTT